MAAAGMINHNRVFFTAVGEPFLNTFLPYCRWTEVLETLPLRYRKPYNSRHSFISWRLMVGHNRLLVAHDDGHSVATMERTYAAWIGVQSQRTSSGSKLRWQAGRWRIVMTRIALSPAKTRTLRD